VIPPGSKSRLLIRAAVGLALVGAGGAMIRQAWKITAPLAIEDSVEKTTRLLEAQVGPLIAAEADANKQSLRIAQERLHETFQRYRGRAPKFAQELTHWGVKWKLMKSTVHDWWKKDHESARVAQKAFADNVFSEEELKRDLEEVMRELLAELEANRNTMLVEAHAAISHSDLPLASLTAEEFSRRFNRQAVSIIEQRAKEVPQLTLLSAAGGLSASVGAGYLAETVAALLVRWAATAATTAGGSTIGGAVVGGGGGSTIGPWGTVIGLTAGLVVGGVVDWAMESRFKEKVTRQTIEILDGMEKAALHDRDKGLYAILERLVLENKRAHEGAMRALVEGLIP
jgi:outer membrane lipoprotein SlyB